MEILNDAIRRLIDYFVGVAALVFRCGLKWRLRFYTKSHASLRGRFGISDELPIRGYDDETRRAVDERYRTMQSGTYAYTSGSMKDPKRIAFDRRRIRRTRLVFVGTMFRNLAATLQRNRTFFAFVPLRCDRSLTSMMAEEGGPPSYLCSLQAPHSLQADPWVREAAEIHGDTAVRLWLMTISNPGLLYATNPSSIATFFHNLQSEWPAIRRLAANPPAALRRIQTRIASRGAEARLNRIAGSETALKVEELFPGLRAFSCWDGGYVKPFIEQIRAYLPEDRYRFVPMYSMSTETIETVTFIEGEHLSFLPIAPDVLYEFVEIGNADLPENLLLPAALQIGKRYAMVVSDPYGLRRYQTEDVFECAGYVGNLPDLRFIQRRNLSYSFTGEKLTGDQLKRAYAEARLQFPELQSEDFLTCFPSRPAGEFLPCYRLVLVATSDMVRLVNDRVPQFIQSKLEEINSEFGSKVRSGRLGAMKLEVIEFNEFVSGAGSESQFKFLPLYPKLWEARI